MKQHELKLLFMVDAIKQVVVQRDTGPGTQVCTGDGWFIRCQIRKNDGTLEWDCLYTAAKGDLVRTFSTLDAVAKCLLAVDITDFTVCNRSVVELVEEEGL